MLTQDIILWEFKMEKWVQIIIDSLKEHDISVISYVPDISIDKVTKEMRYRAKAVNFGLLYGQKSFGLSKELDIPIRDAKKIIDTYFEKYPKIKAFIEMHNTIQLQMAK